MTSVLVTGPNGLLGSTLLRVLKDEGMIVHAYDGDITDAQEFGAFVGSLDTLDAVVHTAAATDVNRCEKEQEWCTNVNVRGTKNVRDATASRSARLVYISTVSVFDGEKGGYVEEDEPNPKNHYNSTKHLGEKIIAEYEKSLILRLNLIGIHPDGSRGKNFMEWLVDSVKGNKDIKLFTDIRINPLSNWTLAEMIRDLILKWPEDRVLHLGSRTVLSKADIGRIVIGSISGYLGNAEYVSSKSVPTTAYRPKEMWLNVDSAQELGLAMPMLEDEILRIIENLKPQT